MPLLLAFAGYALLFVGGIMMLVAAFRESVLWGLACLFLPFVSFFFLIVHWSEAKKGFFIQILGVVLLIAGLVIEDTGSPVFR